MMNNKEKLYENFVWWVTCIPDKIELLKTITPKEISTKLNGTFDSLDILGDFMVNNYTQKTIRDNFELWDAVAAYIGFIYKNFFSDSRWCIELDDKRFITYNEPRLIQIKHYPCDFAPYREVLRLLYPPGNPSHWSKEILFQKDTIEKLILEYGDRTEETLSKQKYLL